MLKNKFINFEKKLSEKDCLEVERRFNFKFPKEVKAFYLEYNGGEPEKYIFIDEDDDKYIIQKVLPIKYSKKKNTTLESYIFDCREDEILPEWLIPFAYDPGGNIYCFSIKKDEFGSIYFFDHEYDLDEDIDDYLIYLSDSIIDFFNSLTI